MKRWPVLAFAFASLALGPSIAIAAAEWQVIKVNGHDYLSVDNISKFYELPAEVVPSGAKIQKETADRPLEFVSGSREAIINGARSWLCFPVIEQDGKSLVTRTDVAKTIEPLVRPHRVPNVGNVQTVVLDAGHGGHDKGQVSRYGAEKDFALDVARKLRTILQAKGLKVIMTREGDYFVPLEVRAKIANSARNSIFVSIHFNGERMMIRTPPGSRFFRLRRVVRRQLPTAPSRRKRTTCNQAARSTRKARPCRLAFIIRFLGTSPSTTVVSNARGSLCYA